MSRIFAYIRQGLEYFEAMLSLSARYFTSTPKNIPDLSMLPRIAKTDKLPPA
jgi:hypothetical protein